MAKQKSQVISCGQSDAAIGLYTTKGVFLAAVDLDDSETLEQFNWHKVGKYVGRSYKRDGKDTMELLHRHVAAKIAKTLGLDINNVRVKFRNDDPTDCRRENLILRPKKLSHVQALIEDERKAAE